LHITGLDILTADVGSPGAPRVYVFVRVQTDEGISGIGEPSCVGKEQAVVGAVCDLEHLVLGADPLAIERLLGVMTRTVIWRTGPVLSAAVSGIEHALWDIKSKALGVPCGSCWVDAAVIVSRRRAQAPGRGLPHRKIHPLRGRTGPGFDVAHGQRVEARVAAVREVLGDEIGIAIDAHGLLNPVNAVEMARRIASLADVRRRIDIPVATRERLFGRHAFRDLLVHEAVDVIQADVGNAGGILEVYKIAAMADSFYVSMAPHNPWSPLSTAISLHLDAVLPNFLIQEIPTAGAHAGRARLLRQQIESPNEGFLNVPDGPGWGVDLDDEFIAAHPWDPSTSRAPWRPQRPDGGLIYS
jgi:galactonate dehydratase